MGEARAASLRRHAVGFYNSMHNPKKVCPYAEKLAYNMLRKNRGN